MRLRSAIVLVVLCLGLSTVSRADTVYTWSVDYGGSLGPGSTIDLQFSVPSILTTQTTITSFSNISLGTAFGTCSIMDFLVPVSTSHPGFSALVEADFASACGPGGFYTGAASFFTQPLTSDGIYTAYSSSGTALGSLTIATTGVPEPNTLALLLTGFMALTGLAFFRKRRISRLAP
jgi:hypothetical protein